MTDLVVHPEGNRSLGKRSCRWENDIKIDIKETVDVDWIHLVQVNDRWPALCRR